MNNPSFHLNVNGQFEFELKPDDIKGLDLVTQGDHFHLLQNNQAFKAELERFDTATRTYTLLVNGLRYTVTIQDENDKLVQAMGLKIGVAHKESQIKAPMPGLVLNVQVETGQEVAKGDTLVILEAMKMENVIKASSDGKVKSVPVHKGMAVEKGALLVEME